MISALMTVYNGEKYIEECITSVLNQTVEEFELIIVDDGSTDKTINKISNFKDGRIKLIQLENNIGVGGAILEGLKYCNGKYIVKIDADDISHPQRFEKQLNYLIENEDIGVVGTFVNHFTDSEVAKEGERFKGLKNKSEYEINNIYMSDDIAENIYKCICIIHSSIMFRKEILQIATYQNLRICEDYDVIYKWNSAGVKFYKIPEVLTYVRVSENSTTTMESKMIAKNIIEIKLEQIKKIFSENKFIYLWGTGGLSQALYIELTKMNFEIHGFLDNDVNRQGKRLFEKEIFNWDKINKDEVGVIVAATPVRFEIEQRLKRANKVHLKNYMIFL